MRSLAKRYLSDPTFENAAALVVAYQQDDTNWDIDQYPAMIRKAIRQAIEQRKEAIATLSYRVPVTLVGF